MPRDPSSLQYLPRSNLSFRAYTFKNLTPCPCILRTNSVLVVMKVSLNLYKNLFQLQRRCWQETTGVWSWGGTEKTKGRNPFLKCIWLVCQKEEEKVVLLTSLHVHVLIKNKERMMHKIISKSAVWFSRFNSLS